MSLNAAASCMEAVEAECAKTPPPACEMHARVRWFLSLFRSGQYRPVEHYAEIAALADECQNHDDPEVRAIATALKGAVS